MGQTHQWTDCVGDIFREKGKWIMKRETLRRLNSAKLEDIIWMGQVNVKNGIANDEVVNCTADVCDKFCVQKTGVYFAEDIDIVIKMNTV
jgi:hypothetical protein